jgi:hypothetical protein
VSFSNLQPKILKSLVIGGAAATYSGAASEVESVGSTEDSVWETRSTVSTALSADTDSVNADKALAYSHRFISETSQARQTISGKPQSTDAGVDPHQRSIIDYIHDLADPAADTSLSSAKRPAQATFQCSLCPKRFARAYNLRSHLRTHIDKTPYVCTVCGKLFARLHDLKRHEGLHSGEKKFVCRGDLSTGGQWGCGRRFAKADALGRHFRSEAGRFCIKPVIDECKDEYKITWKQLESGSFTNSEPFILPSALIAQYPALSTLDWGTLGMVVEDKDDHLESEDEGGSYPSDSIGLSSA